MSNSLVLNLQSNHYGALASLIGRIPSLNCENVEGNYIAVIRSISSLSVVPTLSTVRIGFVVSEWYDFHRNLFPSRFLFPFVVLFPVMLPWFVCYYMLLQVSHNFVLGYCSRSVL